LASGLVAKLCRERRQRFFVMNSHCKLANLKRIEGSNSLPLRSGVLLIKAFLARVATLPAGNALGWCSRDFQDSLRQQRGSPPMIWNYINYTIAYALPGNIPTNSPANPHRHSTVGSEWQRINRAPLMPPPISCLLTPLAKASANRARSNFESSCRR
jgi:hypothetical protein